MSNQTFGHIEGFSEGVKEKEDDVPSSSSSSSSSTSSGGQTCEQACTSPPPGCCCDGLWTYTQIACSQITSPSFISEAGATSSTKYVFYGDYKTPAEHDPAMVNCSQLESQYESQYFKPTIGVVIPLTSFLILGSTYEPEVKTKLKNKKQNILPPFSVIWA